MRPGKKPAPAAVKIARGTFRQDRDKKSSVAAIPMTDRPKPPAILGKTGKQKWEQTIDRLTELKLVEARFLDALEMYCRAWDRLEHYENESKEKEFVEVESGYVCAHPAIGLAKQARDEIRRYQSEFGFTPSSADGIGGTPMKEKTGVPSRRRDLA